MVITKHTGKAYFSKETVSLCDDSTENAHGAQVCASGLIPGRE